MSVIDGIMVVLFILFMIFVFGGYHKNKSAEREAGFKREEQQKKKDKEGEV
jgi:Ca2+/Na+ antiporter